MKVAIAVDFLTSHNHYTKMLQSFIELYPDCEIFALAHIPGEIDEFIEQRKITSSYLSKFIKKDKDLEKYVYLFVAAAQSIFIPCCFDKIIFLTSGFALNYKFCQDSETFLYQYNDLFQCEYVRSKGILNKFFRKYIFSRTEKALAEFKGKQLNTKVSPPFEVKDFPVFAKSLHDHFKKKFVSINIEGVSEKNFKKSLILAQKCQECSIIVFGKNEEILTYSQNSFMLNDKQILFEHIPEISASNHATILATSIYIIDLSYRYWPTLAMIACKMKLSAIINESWKNHPFFIDLNNMIDINSALNDTMKAPIQVEAHSFKIEQNMSFKRVLKKEFGF